MERLAKPRKKKKELKLTIKMIFEAFNDDDYEAKMDLKKFRLWLSTNFPSWSDTILQHFLYQNGLSQSNDDPKYILSVNVDKILKDESAVQDERNWINEELSKANEKTEQMIKRKEDKLFGRSTFEKPKLKEQGCNL